MTFLYTGILVGALLEMHPEHAACLEALPLADYETAIGKARRQGVMGGGIYDSLHATFARRKGARRIVTRNPSHFAHAAPDLEILTP